MKELMISDKREREQAIRIDESFIVQAPAGSGKTELLTQRFLNLLAHVNQSPEEILAITFTRKAAAEMQTRILDTLKAAHNATEPSDEFQKTKWQLAQAVLKRNEQESWHLLENPNRLRIQTIDSFCASLTQQMPILSRFGSQPAISDAPRYLYEAAIDSLIQSAEQDKTVEVALKSILRYLDNRLSTLKTLLVQMLAKRDQWLPDITRTRNEKDLRLLLERNLQAINQDLIDTVHSHASSEFLSNINSLLEFASQYANDDKLIKQYHTSLEHKPYWLMIAELFLTNEHQRRKQINKQLGFPAASSTKDKNEKSLFDNQKAAMKYLLESASDAFIEALVALRFSPTQNYSDAQWELLSALFLILPLAAAHLTLQFKEKNEIDFSEMTQAALAALGEFDSPSELALSLDYQINHILVDEFQDTSITQLRLLERLTLGWENGDGRTLFLVGDPMQSIYRFRQAEVGLFLRAQQEGIGEIHLTPLTLSTNFRSTESLIDWINGACETFFPTEDRITEGAVSYSRATSIHPANDAAINIHRASNSPAQIIEIIQQTKNRSADHSIAILVKARSHLLELLPKLREAHISYQAVEIEPLEHKLVIRDLFALTKALLHLADRTAWLSILRAPWCGLALKDLLLVSQCADKKTILENLQNEELISQLTMDGQHRARAFLKQILPIVHERARMPLRDWIETAWHALQGDRLLLNLSDENDVNLFFDLLNQYDVGGDLDHFSQFESALTQLYASPVDVQENAVQVMTIHKAKGLEFDTVILPDCHRHTATDSSELLLFADLPRIHHDIALVFAPIKAADQEEDEIYRYLKHENDTKSLYENYRLLYVALTRAKSKLHLIGDLNPASRSFFQFLWPVVETALTEKESNTFALSEPEKNEQQLLSRLHLKDLRELPFYPMQKSGDHFTFDENPHQTLKQTVVGTLTHQILYQIACNGLDKWTAENIERAKSGWMQQLRQFGLSDQAEIENLITIVADAVTNSLADSRGRWILESHLNGEAEYALIDREGAQHIIDRTFVDDDNRRWIIDYKTTLEDIDDAEQFLSMAQEKHAVQLDRYRKAFSSIEKREIRAGIYYPFQQLWIEI